MKSDADKVEQPSEVQPTTNKDGVDLTQIRAMRRMSTTERARALKKAANALIRLRQNARRV